VNADDFGLSAGVNRGILEAHAAGVVSSVSVLVNAPGWEDARASLPATRGALGVGLHLNLTAGAPLRGGGGTLVRARTGRFHALPALVARALAGRIDPDEVAAECAAQLARLRETGATVTHLDSHRHVHVLPGIWGAAVATARREGVRFVRVPLEPLAARASSWRALLKGTALGAAWRVASRRVAAVAHADHFHGLALQGDRRFAARLLALLDRLEPGLTELMVHPGHPDAALAAWDGGGYTAPRAAELAALTSPAVRACFRAGAFRLVHFGGGAP
jgi:predicted glycoside hydrolase/deacetylase ChbG (UPF0249 family)